MIVERTKASLLWGVVGALSFLVLARVYELVSGGRIATSVLFGVALLVGVGATGATYAADEYLYGTRTS